MPPPRAPSISLPSFTSKNKRNPSSGCRVITSMFEWTWLDPESAKKYTGGSRKVTTIWVRRRGKRLPVQASASAPLRTAVAEEDAEGSDMPCSSVGRGARIPQGMEFPSGG